MTNWEVNVRGYHPKPDVVDQRELQAWRDKINKGDITMCPKEVKEYIEALAAKLDDFIQVKKKEIWISGYDLILCGMKELKGEKIDPWEIYPTPLPIMLAADHRAAMYRIFRRRGKQGLIDFTKGKVKGTELARALEILNVAVFHEERPEFKKIMREISEAKKLESKIDL